MLTLDRALDELWQQSTDGTTILTLADLEIVEPFNEVTTPFITPRQQFWFEPTVVVVMPWIRAQLW